MHYIQEYDSDYSPPMPTAEITIFNPRNDRSASLVALIDSGADGTYIPSTVVRQLGLRHSEWNRARGISGIEFRVPIYLVDLMIGSIDAGRVRIVGDEQGQVIIGRNVLNWLLVTLDGMAQTLTVEDY